MKTMVSRFALVGVVFAFASRAFSAAAQDDARELRPVAVVTFSGYGEFKGDVEYLAKLAGSPDTATSVEQWLSHVTNGQAMAAIDPARPWGMVFNFSDASELRGVGFLPVGDISKFVGIFSLIFGDPTDAGDDIYEFDNQNGHYYVTQKGKWAYFTLQKDALDALPSDPLASLGGLDKQYDLAVRVNLQNVPQAQRDTAAAAIQQWLEPKLSPTTDDDISEPNAPHANAARGNIERLVKRVHELDRITVGLNIDREKNRTDLDLEITALPGSAAAKAFAAASKRPKASRLAGALLPDAILSLHVNSPLTAESEVQTETWLRTLGGQFLARMENDDDLDDNQKAQAKKSVGKLLDALDETMKKESRLNFGLVVASAETGDEFADLLNEAVEDAFPNRVQETIIGAGTLTVIAGGSTANAAAVENAAMQIAAILADGSGQDEPTLNVEKYKGRRVHTFSVMAPQTMRAQWPLRTLRNLLGNPAKVVVAFGENTFYVAVGEKCTDAIKRAIDRSTETPGKGLPVVSATLSLSRVWKLIASQSQNKQAARLAASLKTGGKDDITFTVEPVNNGMRYRFEGEDGFNMLLGGSLAAAASALAAAGQ